MQTVAKVRLDLGARAGGAHGKASWCSGWCVSRTSGCGRCAPRSTRSRTGHTMQRSQNECSSAGNTGADRAPRCPAENRAHERDGGRSRPCCTAGRDTAQWSPGSGVAGSAERSSWDLQPRNSGRWLNRRGRFSGQNARPSTCPSIWACSSWALQDEGAFCPRTRTFSTPLSRSLSPTTQT